MAYDEYLADRIRRSFKHHNTPMEEKKMMGGLCFMVDEKMCCGIHFDKTYGDHLIMARIGEEAYEEEITKSQCLPMDFTGRPMKGYIFVTPAGFDTEEELNYWIGLCIAFNPQAQASAKKKK